MTQPTTERSAESARLTTAECQEISQAKPSPVALVEAVERIVTARLREREDRVRQEFANIGPWKVGHSALNSATGGDSGVIGSILSQIRRQVVDGYITALRTPPAKSTGDPDV